jgi:catechol 2,3-dioxygenase-like lactoylglutathione lyase family enzyme
MFNVIRIDHVSLNATDRPRTIDWYAEVLGLAVGRRHDQLDVPVFLGPDRAQLGLFGDEPAGLRHIAIATDASSHRELIARLDAHDIAYRPEHHSASFSVYFEDPDGATLEVLVPTA